MIAVIGSGYWGKNLVRNFHSLGVLSVVCDSSESLLEQVQANYPGVQTCVAYNTVLQNPDIKGVVIATPAETHNVLVKEALLAGKHVFVEKPLALNSEQGQELVSLSESCGLTLFVGHLLRYHPYFMRLQEMVTSGDLGRIDYIYSNRLNLGKIRREENILWSFAPHDISMILALAGEMPESVIATGGNYLHKEIADVTTTHLEFPSGMRAHVFVSWLHPHKEQRLVVVGEKKMAVFDDTKPWEEKLLLYAHSINWTNSVPVPDKAQAEAVVVPEEEPLRKECEAFVQCITEEGAPVTDGEEGLRVLRVLNGAQQSLDNDGLRVDLGDAGVGAADVSIHPTAVIDDDVAIGSGTSIWHFAHVMSGAELGRNCNLGQNVLVGSGVKIGNGCKIQNNVSVYPGVTLEDEVFCGPSMVFTNVHNPRSHIRRMSELRETLVGKRATLGANSTIVCGNTVGPCAFVGAGAVVTKDVPAHALVVGNPARQIGWMCECGVRLDEALHCPQCGNTYEQHEDGLRPSEGE